MPAETPQGIPESITFDSFTGLKNTLNRERLGPHDLAVAVNVDLDDSGQPHRRRGCTLVASGDFHSLFNADDGTVYGVKDGDLGVINPDYSFDIVLANVAGDYDIGQTPLDHWQIGDDIYFTSPYSAGIITHSTKQVNDWGPAQNFFLSPVVDPTSTLPAIRVKLLGAPPLASYIAYYNGRLYLAAGNMLWATEFQLYNLVDKNRGFIQFEDTITMVGVVTDGIYVGTVSGVWFLLGGAFERLARTRVMDSPVIPGSMIYIPGELANPPQIGPGVDTPASFSIAFFTTRGFCTGEDSGKCTNLTESKVFFPVAKRATAFFRRQDGMNQYVACLDSGSTPVNGARIGDYVDATIIRGVIPPPLVKGQAPVELAMFSDYMDAEVISTL
jgi:hypothetical protein